VTTNIFELKTFLEGSEPNKLNHLKTEQLGVDTYYFKPGQTLPYHRHVDSDQVFLIIQGEGEFSLKENDSEETIKIWPGMIILAPANVWHQLTNTGRTELIATQVTKV